MPDSKPNKYNGTLLNFGNYEFFVEDTWGSYIIKFTRDQSRLCVSQTLDYKSLEYIGPVFVGRM